MRNAISFIRGASMAIAFCVLATNAVAQESATDTWRRKTWVLKDTSAAFELAVFNARVARDPRQLSVVKAASARLFESAPPNGAFADKTAFRRLFSLSRLPPNRGCLLELMNLERLRSSLEGGAPESTALLKKHYRTLEATIVLPQEEVSKIALNKATVIARINSLRRFHILLMRGVDPFRGPTKQQARELLISAGMPEDLVKFGLQSRPIERREGEKVLHQWCASLTLEVGLNEKFPPVVNVAIADADYGFLYEPHTILGELDQKLADFVAKGHQVHVGGSTLKLERLFVSDGNLRSDWSISLPGNGGEERRILLRGISPKLDGKGSVKWFEPSGRFDVRVGKLDLRIPVHLSRRFTYAAETGILSVNGAPTTSEIAAVRGLLTSAAQEQLNPATKLFLRNKAILAPDRYQVGKVLPLSIPLSCRELVKYSSATGFLSITGTMSPVAEADLRLALSAAIDLQFREPINMMVGSAPRLDLNTLVPLTSHVGKLPEGDVRFEGFRNRYVARTSHRQYARAMLELGTKLRDQPDAVRSWTVDPPDRRLSVIGEADCVFRIADHRFMLGPIRVVKNGDNVKVLASRAEVRIVRSNRDIMREYLRDAVPIWEKPGADDSMSISSIDFALSKSQVHVRATWRSEFFSESIPIDAAIPLRTGGKFDGDVVLRTALSGKRIQFGPQLSVKLDDDLTGRPDWPGALTVSGKPLRISLRRNNDGWGLTLNPQNIRDLIPTHVQKAVQDAIGNAQLSVRNTKLSLPTDGHSAAILTALSWKAGEKILNVPISVDRFGIHISDWQHLVRELVLATLASEHHWPIKITRVQTIDGLIHFDAAFELGDARVASLLGGTIREGRVVGGIIQVDSSAVENWLGKHARNRFLRINKVRFVNGKGLVCDVESRLEPFGAFAFPSVPMSGGENRFELLVEACISQLSEKLKPSKTASVGPLTLALKPSNSDGQFHLSASLRDPKLKLEWESVTISAQGVQLGRGKVVEPQLPQLRARLAEKFKSVFKVETRDFNVDSVGVIGNNFQDIGIEFSISATINEKKLVIKGNRITSGGLKPGKLPDVEAVFVEVVRGAVGTLETWGKDKEITLGSVASLKVTEVDRAARKAKAIVRVFGEDAGSLNADFTTPGSPSLTLDEPQKLLQRIVSVTPLASIASSGSRSFRISSGRIKDGGLLFAVDFRPPILEEFVATGTVVVSASGVRFDASKDWQSALWRIVASKVVGLKWHEGGFPVAIEVEKAVALRDGVALDIKCSVEGLGDFSLSGVRVSHRGVNLDQDVLLANLADLVGKKLRDVLPDAVCSVKSSSVEGQNVVITLQLAVDGIDPFDIRVSIGKDGSLKGFDEKLLLKPFLDKLAGELKGQTLSLPGDCNLTVDRAVVTNDLSGVALDGTISAFEVLTAKVTNVVFTGRSFLTDKMKVESANIAGLSEALGLSALGDAGISVKDIGPRLKDGKFTGINLTARFVVAELLEAEVSAGIGKGGVKVQLPIALVADGVRIPVPPCFALSRWKAEIAEAYLGVGCSLGLTVPKSERLIRVDGLLKFPLKRPWQVSAEGDLVLLGFLKPGHSEVVLDFEEKEFRALMTLDLIQVLSFDGRFLARMDPKNFLIEGSGELIFLGTKLAGGYVRIDSVVFVGRAELAVLGVKASASLDGKWAKPLDTWVAAEVGFDLPLVGRIVGSDVKGNPTRGAEFAATILAQRIRLLAVDFEGITKERILDVLFQDRIIPAGLKLLATEGGGGSTVVTRDGSLVRIDPRSGDFTAVSEQDGAFVLRRGNIQAGGGSTEEILMPHRNQIARVERDAQGLEIKPPVLRPYRKSNKVSEEQWTPPPIIRRYD